MQQANTRQRILDKALELFSAKGYDAVGVRGVRPAFCSDLRLHDAGHAGVYGAAACRSQHGVPDGGGGSLTVASLRARGGRPPRAALPAHRAGTINARYSNLRLFTL